MKIISGAINPGSWAFKNHESLAAGLAFLALLREIFRVRMNKPRGHGVRGNIGLRLRKRIIDEPWRRGNMSIWVNRNFSVNMCLIAVNASRHIFSMCPARNCMNHHRDWKCIRCTKGPWLPFNHPMICLCAFLKDWELLVKVWFPIICLGTCLKFCESL